MDSVRQHAKQTMRKSLDSCPGFPGVGLGVKPCWIHHQFPKRGLGTENPDFLSSHQDCWGFKGLKPRTRRQIKLGSNELAMALGIPGGAASMCRSVRERGSKLFAGLPVMPTASSHPCQAFWQAFEKPVMFAGVSHGF